MTLAAIEPATFRFVAQHLNHCATAVPICHISGILNTSSSCYSLCQLTNIQTHSTKDKRFICHVAYGPGKVFINF